MKRTRNISRKFYRQLIVGFLACCLTFNASVPVVLATPNGSDVVAGSAAVNQAANTTTVTMGSARAVINWDSLNTSQNEVLEFLKAGGNFAVLNRVIQGGATDFRGSLFGNQGHIIIVNPQGIVFGPTALVQAYKFTASGLNIKDSDFMNGIYRFAGGNGTVSNYGNIAAQQVNLIGQKILNAGTITSPNGYVIMAAGDKVFLGNEGSDVVVEVESVSVPDPTDPASEGIGDVINEGTVEAAGGKIVLAAGDTFSRAIEGLDSLTVAVDGGTGRVGQFGTLSVDGVDGDGGSINISAADTVALSSDSLTTANAGTNGDGGVVTVYSPDTALFWEDAKIEAKGGSESGNGGFIEVSGKENFEIWGLVDTTAPYGATGTFLIDPTNVTISSFSNQMAWDSVNEWFYNSTGNSSQRLRYSTLQNQLDSTDVTVTTDIGGTLGTAGWIEVSHSVTWDSDYSLTLTANNYIWIDDPIKNTGSGNLTLNAGSYIGTGSDSDITLYNGTFEADAVGNIYIGDDIYAGNITLKDNVILNPGYFYQNQEISADDTLWAQGTITKNDLGEVVLAGGTQAILDGAVTINDGSLTLNGGNVTTTGGIGLSLTASDNITTNAPITINGAGSLTMIAGGSINAYSKLESTGGQIELSASDATINLWNNVTAGLDLILNNNTVAADGITLKAGVNVELVDPKTLTALGDLVIEATTGTITALGGIIMPAAPAPGATLTLIQGESLDIPTDVLVLNTNNSDLIAESSSDSVTLTAAAEWQSIKADAYVDILLSDDGGDITTKALTATTGNIQVNAQNSGKVLATDDIIANAGSIALSGADGIEASADILAGAGLTFDDEVTAVGTTGQKFDAGSGTLWAKDTITKTGDGTLVLGGDILVDLDGIDSTSGYSVSVANGDLTIDGPVDAEGHLIAHGDIHLQGTAYLAGDVISTGSGIILEDDVTADGTGDQTFDAGSGKLVAENGADIEKSTAGTLTLTADAGIELGGNVTGTHTDGSNLVFTDDVTADGTGAAADQWFNAVTGTLTTQNEIDIEKTTAGTLTIGGLNGIYLSGNVIATAALANIAFIDDVTANRTTAPIDQRFEAEFGTLSVSGITKTKGDLYLAGDGGIDIGGTIDIDAGSLYIEDDFTAEGDLIASEDVEFNGSVVNGILDGAGNQKIDAEGGELWANGTLTKTTSGDLTLAGDEGIDLDGTVDVYAGSLFIEDDFTAEGDLLAYSNVEFNFSGFSVDGILDGTDDQRIDAEGGILWANGTLTKTDNGDLHLVAGGMGTPPIDLDDDVDVRDGSLYIEDDFTAAGDLTASKDVEFNGSVVSGILDGAGKQKIEAEDGTLWANGTLTKTVGGDLYLAGDDGIDLDDDVAVQAGSLFIEDDTVVAADKILSASSNIKIEDSANLTGEGNLRVEAGDDITLGDATEANGDLYLYAADYTNLGHSDGSGKVWAKGSVETTGSDMYIAGDSIEIEDDVDSDGSLTIDTSDSVNGDIDIDGDVDSAGPMTIDSSGSGSGDIEIAGDVDSDDSMTINTSGSSSGNVDIDGDVESDGLMIIDTRQSGSGDVDIDGDVESGDSIIIDTSGSVDIEGDVKSDANSTMTSAGGIHLGGSLRSLNGFINLSSYGLATIDITGPVNSDGDLDMYSLAGGILIGDDVTSDNGHIDLESDDGDIIIDGSVTSDGYIDLDCHWELSEDYDDGSIEVYGDVESIASSVYMYADDGIYVTGSVTSATTMDLISLGLNTIEITGDVESGAQMYLNSYGDIVIDGSVSSGTPTTGQYPSMEMVADGGIHLGGSVTSAGLMVLESYGPATIEITGPVYSDGTVDMYSYGGGILIGDDVTSDNSYIHLRADNGGDIVIDGSVISDNFIDLDCYWESSEDYDDGSIEVYGDVESIASSVYMYADDGIYVTGSVTSATTMDLISLGLDTIEITGDVESGAQMNLDSYGDIVIDGSVSSGMPTIPFAPSMYMEADGGIHLGGSVTSAGPTVLTSYGSATIDITGPVYSAGPIDMYSSGGGIHIGGYVRSDDSYIYLDSDYGDIYIAGPVESTASSIGMNADYGIDLDGSVTSATTMSLTSDEPGYDIDIAGPVQSGTNMTMTSAGGIYLKDSVKSLGGGFINLTSYGPATIDIIGLVDSAGALTMTSSGGGIHLHNFVTSVGPMNLTSDLGDIYIAGPVESTASSIGMNADYGIDLDGSVTSDTTMSLTSDEPDYDIDIAGPVQSGTNMTMTSAGGIYLGDSVTSLADGFINLTSYGSATIDIAGSVNSAGVLTMTSSGGGIHLGNSVTSSGSMGLTSNGGDIYIAGPVVTTSLTLGDMTLFADYGIDLDSSVTSATSMSLTSDDPGYDIDIAGPVQSGTAMTMTSADGIYLRNAVTSNSGPINLTSYGLDTIDITGPVQSGGTLAMESAGSIYLRDFVTSVDQMTLDAEHGVIDVGYYVDSGSGLTMRADDGGIHLHDSVTSVGPMFLDSDYGDIVITGPVESTASSVGMYADEGIYVYDDVTAGTNIDLTSNGTDTIDITGAVYAGIDIDMISAGSIHLGDSVRAETGYIYMDSGDVDTIEIAGPVYAGTSVEMYSAGDIHLHGSVTSNSDYMNLYSLGGNIYLDRAAYSGRSMRLKAVEVEEDVDYFVGGDVYAYGTLTAVGDIDILSADHTDDTTYLYNDVTSIGGSIKLHNNTWAADGVKIDAAWNVIVGGYAVSDYTGTTLTGEGALTVEADNSIYLGGDVDASVDLPGDLIITAGDEIYAYGYITAHDGSIVITSGPMTLTTYLYKDVTASENVTLHGPTILCGEYTVPFDQRIDALNGTLWADGTVTKTTEGDLYLAGDQGIDLDDDVDVVDGSLFLEDNTIVAADKKLKASEDITVGTGEPISPTTLTGEGNLTVDAGGNITVGGAVETLAAGYLDMDAGGGIYLHDSVTSGGYMDLYSGGSSTIEITGPVYSGSWMYMESYGNIELGNSVTSDEYISLFTYDGGAIVIDGPVLAADYVDMYSDYGITIHNSVDALSSEDGHIYLYDSEGGSINIDGHVDAGTYIYMCSYGGGIYLHDYVTAQNSYIELYTEDGDIEIIGPVQSATSTYMYADGGSIHLHDSVTTGEYLDLESINNTGTIEVGGPIDSGTYIYMLSDGGGILLHDSVTAAQYIDLDSYNGDIDITGPVYAGYWIDMETDGSITIGDGSTTGYDYTIGDYFVESGQEMFLDADGGDITIFGPVKSGSYMNMFADNGDIHLYDAVTSIGNMFLDSDYGNIILDGPADSGSYMRLRANEEGPDWGDVIANSTLTAVYDIDIISADTTTYLYDDVTSTEGSINLHNNTWADDGVTIDAAVDVMVGEDLDPATLTGAGDLTVIAVDNITLTGAVEAAGDLRLYADNDYLGSGYMWARSSVKTTNGGDMYVEGASIWIDGFVDSAGLIYMDAGYGNIVLGSTSTTDDYVQSATTMDMYAAQEIYIYGPVTSGDHMNLNSYDSDSIFIHDDVYSGGNMDMYAYGSISIDGYVQSVGYMNLESDNGRIDIDGYVYSGSYMNMDADGDIVLADDSVTDDYVQSVRSMDLRSNGGIINIWSPVTSGTPMVDEPSMYMYAAYDISIHGPVTSSGDMDLWSNNSESIHITDDVDSGGNMDMHAHGGIDIDGCAQSVGYMDLEVDYGDIDIDGYAYSGAQMNMYVDNGGVYLHDSVTSGDYMWLESHHGDIEIDGSVYSGANMDMYVYDGGIYLYDSVTSAGYMNLESHNDDTIEIYGFADSGLSMDMYSEGGIYLYSGAEADESINLYALGDVIINGDLMSYLGSIEITSAPDTIYLNGDTIAFDDVTLYSNTQLQGVDDDENQIILAENGTLTAYGYVQKQTPGEMLLAGGSDGLAVDLLYDGGLGDPAASTCFGNLWILGAGDVRIAGAVTTFGDFEVEGDYDTYGCPMTGGVFIGSDTGRVYTTGNALNIPIEGKSDHADQLGVYDYTEHGWLYDGEPIARHAILITSEEDLTLGENSELIARGTYYDGEVDDRDAIGFLDEITTIGNASRNDGDPFDSAIYLASQDDVELGGSIEVIPCDEELEPGVPSGGTVVADAVDTVTFDESFTDSLDETDGEAHTFRLEVCSRNTEWLDEAIDEGTLPYAANPDIMSDLLGDDYVLRGAGLGNPDITDGRAWVLNESPAAPLPELLAAQAEQVEFGEGGCPVLLDWLASELDIPEKEIQTFVSDAFAFATDIQPCVACERLKAAAAILEDPDGAGIAALIQVLSEFAATEAPPSEEQMALIAAALAEHTDDGTYYAAAGMYIDAFVEYVTILTTEMDWTLADATALVMGKYGEPITESGNPALVAYVEARLAAIGG